MKRSAPRGRILAIDPDAKAVVSSGYHNDPVMSNHRDYGFSACLPKPYAIEKLDETLRSLLSGCPTVYPVPRRARRECPGGPRSRRSAASSIEP